MQSFEMNPTGVDAPRLAMCNFMPDIADLRGFARTHGFDGMDWSFDEKSLPETPAAESRWVRQIKSLSPLEVRYHCPFHQVDIGHEEPSEQQRAADLFRRIIRLVAKAGGKYLTLHVGLGHDTTRILSWDQTIANLRALVQYARDHGILLCLENLAWGWTSRPNLFEKLIRGSGAGVTVDLGHAKACEAVQTQQYQVEDFVTPHADRVCNAHVYHKEIDEVGHLPPERVSDMAERLDMLLKTPCRWWVIELRDIEGLLQTRHLIDAYLSRIMQAS